MGLFWVLQIGSHLKYDWPYFQNVDVYSTAQRQHCIVHLQFECVVCKSFKIHAVVCTDIHASIYVKVANFERKVQNCSNLWELLHLHMIHILHASVECEQYSVVLGQYDIKANNQNVKTLKVCQPSESKLIYRNFVTMVTFIMWKLWTYTSVL